MNREEIFKLIEDNGLTLHGDIEHFASLVVDTFYAKYLEQPTPQLTGVVSVTMPEPIGYLCENAVGHKYFRWKKPPSTFKPIPLYTAPHRPWVGLTKEERHEISMANRPYCADVMAAHEEELKRRNT